MRWALPGRSRAPTAWRCGLALPSRRVRIWGCRVCRSRSEAAVRTRVPRRRQSSSEQTPADGSRCWGPHLGDRQAAFSLSSAFGWQSACPPVGTLASACCKPVASSIGAPRKRVVRTTRKRKTRDPSLRLDVIGVSNSLAGRKPTGAFCCDGPRRLEFAGSRDASGVPGGCGAW
jgi:hypothetical protein